MKIKKNKLKNRRVFVCSLIVLSVVTSAVHHVYALENETYKGNEQEAETVLTSPKDGLDNVVENNVMGNTFRSISLRSAVGVDTIRIGDKTRPRVDLVDLASYQSWMNQEHFDELKKNGVKFAVIKTTESNNYSNPAANQQIQRAKRAGLGVGIYHYARFGNRNEAVSEANYALKRVKQLGLPKDTPIVADIEENYDVVGDVKTNLNAFWDVFSSSGYKTHIVYTGGGYSKSAQAIATVGNKRTWWAQYPYTPSSDSLWNSQYGAWQFSSTAQLPSQFGRPGANNIDVSIDYAGIFTGANAPEGEKLEDDRYVTLTERSNTLWADFTWKPLYKTNDLLNRTYHSVAKYHHENGSTYLSLSDKDGNFMGLVNEKAVTVGRGPQGAWLSKSGNAVIMRSRETLWQDFNWVKKSGTEKYLGQQVQVNGMYHHFNGNIYYSLWQNGAWIGYGLKDVVSLTGDESGSPITDNRYVTVVSKDVIAWQDFKWKIKSRGALYQRTLLSRRFYRHSNGSTYLSLYDAAGTWQGYVDERDVNIGKGAQGSWLFKEGYATLLWPGRKIYSDWHGASSGTSSEHLGLTYRINGQYHVFNGKWYVSLYDQNDKWLGYMNVDDVQEGDKPQGVWQSKGGYASVKSSNVKIWSDFNWHTKNDGESVLGKIYKINGKYNHVNGKTYYSMWKADGTWLGYIDSSQVEINHSPQGKPTEQLQYVTVLKEKTVAWKDFDGNIKTPSKDLLRRTVLSRRFYKHANGTTYLSIYDAKNNWLGYIDEKDANKAPGAQGVWLSQNGYATLTQPGKKIYQDWHGKSKITTSDLLGRTFQINGQYHVYDGKWYYSLYDNGKWIGYVNNQDVSRSDVPQGVLQSQDGYGTIKVKNAAIWKNFEWKVAINSTEILGKTFRINGKYVHSNGNTYYSLWKHDGTWLGYANRAAIQFSNGPQGTVTSSPHYVTITAKQPVLLLDFEGHKKQTEKSLFQQTVFAKRYYNHANGRVYLSIYDSRDKWLGYIDQTQTARAKGKEGIWLSHAGIATLTLPNRNIYGDWHGKIKANTTKFLGQKYDINGQYHVFDGKWYLSLYDKNKKWFGYVNVNDVKVSN